MRPNSLLACARVGAAYQMQRRFSLVASKLWVRQEHDPDEDLVLRPQSYEADKRVGEATHMLELADKPTCATRAHRRCKSLTLPHTSTTFHRRWYLTSPAK